MREAQVARVQRAPARRPSVGCCGRRGHDDGGQPPPGRLARVDEELRELARVDLVLQGKLRTRVCGSRGWHAVKGAGGRAGWAGRRLWPNAASSPWATGRKAYATQLSFSSMRLSQFVMTYGSVISRNLRLRTDPPSFAIYDDVRIRHLSQFIITCGSAISRDL